MSATMTTPADQRVRDRIRHDLDTTLIIEAAAGTGKTTELVNRIIAVIASGRALLRCIVGVTFTEKAAGELKLRLREEIERARHDEKAFNERERNHLLASLEQLEEARIGTIHSFCADLLRERPVEARVDPAFEVAPEDIAGGLFENAFERWFEETLKDPGPGMRRLLRRRDAIQGEGPRPIARGAANALREWRDFDAAWERVAFDRNREIDGLVDDIAKLAEMAQSGRPEDWLRRSLDDICRPVSEATRLESPRGGERDYDALEHVLGSILRNQNKFNWGSRGDMFGERPRAEVLALRAALHTRLVEFREAAGKDLAPLLREEMRPVVKYYEALKERAGVLDFLDLLLVARDLVRDNADVRADLQHRFSHIFIDEFQDTDPLQAEILLLLAADDPKEADWHNVRPMPGKLFIVGDPKQSIYRFRRADVALYQGLKRRLTERGAALEHLTVSFRATAELQEMVNAAMAPLMPEESETQPAYVPLQKCREDVSTQPSIVVLPVPAPYSDDGRRVLQWKIDDSLPDATAAYVHWLITQSGWTVTERESPDKRVPIEARHVCILFRRLNTFGRDVTRPYIRALEARHIPHVLIKGGSFNEREEVEAIRNLLGAIERPDDELVVFAALRGPVFAISDASLLEYHETVGSLHPFRKIKETPAVSAEVNEVAHALELLRDLHRGRNRRPIADTIARLLTETRAHAGFAIWPTGEQALANVMRLMDMARRYEARSGATSFRGFVDELEERAERDEASEVPVVEEGTEGVRIMTVHRAKGLEFPVVVLADLTCKETREPSRHVNPARKLCAQRIAGYAPRELIDNADEEGRRESEEATRVLYVAATRARDLLVVPAVGDEEREGWLQGLTPAIFPDPKKRRSPLSRMVPGAAEFGDDSVRIRPQGYGSSGKEKSVAPGMHQARVGSHRVVWWDPSKLELDVRETMGLRQIRLLEADEGKVVSTRGREKWDRWFAQRSELIEAGKTPSIVVKTATELSIATPTANGDAEIEVIETIRDPKRPHGPRFGSLVHMAMLRVSLEASDREILAAVAAEGRMLGADDGEIAAAARAVSLALKSPLMARVRTSHEVRRECPVLLTLEDGAIVEGIADLAFAEGANGSTIWNVVDFKTDLAIKSRLDEYRAQIALYARGISRAIDLPSRGILFWI